MLLIRAKSGPSGNAMINSVQNLKAKMKKLFSARLISITISHPY
jgi:hypothetical protein